MEVEVLDPSQGCTVTEEAAGTGCNKSNSCWEELKNIDSSSSKARGQVVLRVGPGCPSLVQFLLLQVLRI